MSTLQQVHVRVNDAATGRPTPVRIRFVGGDGKYYAPYGRLAEFGGGPGEYAEGNVQVGDKVFAYIDGACEILLPPGPIDVEIHKGPEYLPVRERVHLPQGKLAMRFTIGRWADLRADGWYSGDTHCFDITPHAALLEGGGEDLAVVNLLARHTRRSNLLPGYVTPAEKSTYHYDVLTNITAFSGQQPCLEGGGHLVAVNTFNYHGGMAGCLALLHCHRAVYPLTFGGPDGVDDWNLADWCEQCHRKKGLVVATHFFTRESYDYPRNWEDSEVISDAVLGHIDAVDLGDMGPPSGGGFLWEWLKPWNWLQECGCRISLTGGSGKATGRTTLGRVRTYARLPPGPGLTYTGWIEAVRAGRTFVTNGPLLTLSVNGCGPGSVLECDGAGDRTQITATARSLAPFEALEIVRNGDVIGSASPRASGPVTEASLDLEIPTCEPGWVCARCGGPSSFAHTSPVYVQVAGESTRPRPETLRRLLGCVERGLRLAEGGRFENDRQRQRRASVFRAAEQDLRDRLVRSEAGPG